MGVNIWDYDKRMARLCETLVEVRGLVETVRACNEHTRALTNRSSFCVVPDLSTKQVDKNA